MVCFCFVAVLMGSFMLLHLIDCRFFQWLGLFLVFYAEATLSRTLKGPYRVRKLMKRPQALGNLCFTSLKSHLLARYRRCQYGSFQLLGKSVSLCHSDTGPGRAGGQTELSNKICTKLFHTTALLFFEVSIQRASHILFPVLPQVPVPHPTPLKAAWGVFEGRFLPNSLEACNSLPPPINFSKLIINKVYEISTAQKHRLGTVTQNKYTKSVA